MAKMTSGMRMLAMAKATRRGEDMRRMEDEPEMRRRRDGRGRYMEQDNMRYNRMMERQEPVEPDGENPYGGRPMKHIKPMPDEPGMMGVDYDYRRADGGTGRLSYFRAHKTDPLDQRKGEDAQRMGFQQNERKDKAMDKQTAMEWVECMEDKDGVKGGAYTWHQTQQYGRNMGITGEARLIEFYAAMNAMQSDFWPAAKKFGVDKPEFYAALAKCFIEDPDAVEDKVEKYYECIVRKDEK